MKCAALLLPLLFAAAAPSAAAPVETTSPLRVALVTARPSAPLQTFVVTVSAYGRDIRQITGRAGFRDTAPAWSPNGRWIAFEQWPVAGGEQTIWLIRRDGNLGRRLTHFGTSDAEFSPSFSPSGRRIAFSLSTGTDRGGIYTIRTDGTHLRRVTRDGEDAQPAWSPDGRLIAFRRVGDLYVVRPDGTHRHRLTRTQAFKADPAWSPDGTRLAYTRVPADGGYGDIWIMRRDGSRRHALTSTSVGDESAPSWSPGGAWIAYQRLTGDQVDAYRMPVAGGKATILSGRLSMGAEPAWRPR